MNAAMNGMVSQSPWLKLAAVGTWIVCGLPALATIARGQAAFPEWAAWTLAFLAYGAALTISLWRRGSHRGVVTALVGVQSATAIVLAGLNARGLDTTGVGMLTGVGLLVIVAAQLPHLAVLPTAWAWIAAQTLVMALVLPAELPLADVMTFALGSAGFQAFACMTTSLMLREAAARVDLALINAELHATRALLAEHSRANERLRIARDLHDTLGHHLTALSLQLDVASRISQGDAAARVAQAHAITRLLLAEIRTVVGEMREAPVADVAQTLRSLAASPDTLKIHLDIPDHFTFCSDAQGQALVRCVQEIVTNASRHAQAANLWIAIRHAGGAIELIARDDGRGAAAVRPGNGLTGMRERFAEFSGRLDVTSSTGHGFEVRGVMPVRAVA